MKKNLRSVFALFLLALTSNQCLQAQSVDARNILNGYSIYDNGYIDQPYAVVLNNGDWLCVFTTGPGKESQPGQHIVSTISSDQGHTWSVPADIEPSAGPSASWAVPYLTPFGRIYVFYDYNGENINTLEGKPIQHNSELGWYCYKYSDDHGVTWSDRYKLPMPKAPVDFRNDFKGTVQLFWGIDKPKKAGNSMIFSFTRLGKYVQSDGEGWFYASDNIDQEKDPGQLRWELLPAGDTGLRNPAFGSIQEEFNIAPMNNGDLYCMFRTTMGFAAHAYSHDGAKTWTMPVAATYSPGGRQIMKNPRACPRVFKCGNGKYLFWYHNQGEKGYEHRNPVWISGGIEKEGRLYWSQPEILLYSDDIDVRMSYPDLIEQHGRYWFTETQKTKARVHAIDPALIEGVWNQATAKAVITKGLIAEKHHVRKGQTIFMPPVPGLKDSGFTIALWLKLKDQAPGQVILDSRDEKGKGIRIITTDSQALRLEMSDGILPIQSWDTDPVPLNDGREHHIVFIADGAPDIITAVVDGRLCDGGSSRLYGWGRFSAKLEDVNGNRKLALAPGLHGTISSLRVYNRYLTTSEAISNFHAGVKAGGRRSY